MRLDRFLSNLPQLNRQAARQLLASGRVKVDGAVVCDGLCEVSQFSRIEVDSELLQTGKAARYFMLHKPIGVVSATAHEQHRTVLDLPDEPDKADLHLAGRLDLNTSGLLLITSTCSPAACTSPMKTSPPCPQSWSFRVATAPC